MDTRTARRAFTAHLLNMLAQTLSVIAITVGLLPLSITLYENPDTTVDAATGGIAPMCLLASIGVAVFIGAHVLMITNASIASANWRDNRGGRLGFVVLGLLIASGICLVFRLSWLAGLLFDLETDQIKSGHIHPIYWLGIACSILMGAASGLLSWTNGRKVAGIIGSLGYIVTGVAGGAMASNSLGSLMDNVLPSFFMPGFWIDYGGGALFSAILAFAMWQSDEPPAQGGVGGVSGTGGTKNPDPGLTDQAGALEEKVSG